MPKEKAAAPKAAPTPKLTAHVGPTCTAPLSWWIRPFEVALKKLIRPATANRRRKELIIKMQMPIEVFEQII